MDIRRQILVAALLILSTAMAFFAGYLTHAQVSSGAELPLLAQARTILLDHALEGIPPDPALEYGMIRGMLEAYGDPYTIFVEPPQTELQSDDLEGKFGGIGVRLGRDAENYAVLFPFPDSPAALAGVREGDRLVSAEGLEITPDTPTELIVSTVRGPVGTRVGLTIARPPDYAQIAFAIRRAEIALPSVTWHLAPEEPRLGVVEINLIAASTSQEIQDAVSDMQGRGASHFLLDLRDNGGGLVDAGVEIARLFLDGGVVIQQQYRGREMEAFEVERPGPLADIPLLVLVNHNTASAAEIVAGALQAHGRAQLLGSPTFGKDSIQLVFDLQDGSSMHVTSARWWIPDFEFHADEGGLQPDISISPEAEGADPFVSAAIQALFGSQ